MIKMENKPNKKKMEEALLLLERRGKKAFDFAKKVILQKKNLCEPVREALNYFMGKFWYDIQHPALLSLSCEAVNGDPDITIPIGAATVLLAGAADIHDDIIDKSEIKNSKLTIYGKFGKEIAILTGDALLFEGLMLLYQESEKLPQRQGKRIINLMENAFIEIGNAETEEIKFRRRYNVQPEEYYDIIKMKAAVAEACAQIGAILGGGNLREIKTLGRYGRVLGILMTIRDEFVDIYELDELENRVKNECLPLPILYAFKDNSLKKRLILLLNKPKLTEEDVYKIIELVMNSKEIKELKKHMKSLIRNTLNEIIFFAHRPVFNELRLLLLSTIEDL